jgi:Flp pilus assembly protein TadD
MSRKLLPVWIGLALIVLSLAVLPFWRRHVIVRQDARQLAAGRQALQKRQFQTVLEIAAQHHSLAASAEEWASLETEACVQVRNLTRLAAIYLEDPAAVSRHEEASLLLVRFLYELRRGSQSDALRKSWLGRETRKGAWLAVDADRLIRDGRREEALRLLRETKFNNREDCARLLRLALLSAATPKEAMEYLDAACRADPENPDARLFRAEVLESLGRVSQARVEYLAACNWQPNNPLLFHRLAEFYCRSGNPLMAADAWRQAIRISPQEVFWLRAWFWSRVAGGIEAAEWSRLPLPRGRVQPFFEYLSSLPPSRVWDEEGFSRLVLPAGWSDGRQELFWLRLLQALRDNHLNEAAGLLDRHDAGISWSPGLEKTLRLLVQRQQAPADRSVCPLPAVPAGSHPFFRALARAGSGETPLSPEDERLLAGREAFAAACLAEGWMKAAIFLHDPAADLNGLPDWFAYGLAQSTNFLEGPAAALRLLTRRRSTPLLTCLEGELQLATGNVADAIKLLTPLSAGTDDCGVRAASLLALERLGAKAPAEAERLVNANARLRDSETGREILGQAAVARGDLKTAAVIFQSLRDISPVAKEFLAGQAFAAGDFAEAKRLMAELASQQPDEPRHAANFKAVEAVQKAKAEKK